MNDNLPANTQPLRSRPWIFFVLTFAWSWLFWIPAAILDRSFEELSVVILIGLGGLGPAVSGIGLIYFNQDSTGRRDYWRRVLSPKPIGRQWYGVIFLAPAALTGLAAGLDILLGGTGIGWGEPARNIWATPIALLTFSLTVFLFGPVPEELGWRGYALDHLQGRWTALTASLVLGLAWAAWHLPLFFVEGTYQHGLGAGGLLFWLYMVVIVPQSVLYTWIYNNNGRSILSAILFHFAINFTGELLDITQRTETIALLLWVAAALIVTRFWGARTLTRGGRA